MANDKNIKLIVYVHIKYIFKNLKIKLNVGSNN